MECDQNEKAKITMKNRIVFCDEDIVVAIKPAGMSTIPDKVGSVSFVREVEKTMLAREESLHPINRLDKPVGGLVLFSRSPVADKWFAQPPEKIAFSKFYHAWTLGFFSEKSGELRQFLKRDERSNISRVVPEKGPGAKDAVLQFQIKDEKQNPEGEKFSYAKIILLTGRHHQIRVQMAFCGHPVWGDRKYNPDRKTKRIPKTPALFSSGMIFIPPGQKNPKTFLADPMEWEPNVFVL